jgi:RNA polymerase sigma-70 factor (ECF subfamily)
MADGPRPGLALIEEIAKDGELEDYHLFHATRADLLRRLGDVAGAAASYQLALNLATNEAERRYLKQRLADASL